MKFIRPDKIIAILGFACCFCATIQSCPAQSRDAAVSLPDHQKSLNEYKNKAEAFCAKNLNRFGLDQLKLYDKMLDSLARKEKEDTLSAIVKAYTDKNSHRKSVTDSLVIKSSLLTQTKETAQIKYHGLLKKAAITFFVWLAAVLLLLKFRNRSVKKSQVALVANLAQLKTSEEAFNQGEELFKLAAGWQKKVAAIQSVSTEMKKSILKLGEKLAPDLAQSETFKQLHKNTEFILATTQRFENLDEIILKQQEEPNQEKQLININQLCEHYSDLAYSEMLLEDGTFTCQMTRDFEKNLPSVKIFPEPVGVMMLDIVSNAFNSVRKKQQMEIKGYIGKVSISTRILPRFVQIRVKDNGIGIPDQSMELIYEPFYSTEPVGQGAGLGLYFSKQTITENGGEIKIESDHENATDVYIKFFLKS